MESIEFDLGKQRKKILSSIVTPYEDLLVGPNPESQYYLDLIKLKVALSTNLISLEDVHTFGKELHKDQESIANAYIPIYEPWSQEMIEHIAENLIYLKKNEIVSAKALNSAVLDTFTFNRPHRVPVDTEAEVLKYFAWNPMSSFNDASCVLNLHRSTVYDAYQKLESHHWVRTLGHNNVSAFGLRQVFLLFEMQNQEDWLEIERCLGEFPFTSRVLRYPNSDLIISAFTLPGSSSNLRAFKDGVQQLTDQFFSYSSLHIYEGSGRIMNPSLMKGGEWHLPDFLSKRDFDIDSTHTPFIASTKLHEFMRDLTYVDFLLEEVLCMNARMKPREIQTHLKAQGHTLTRRRITERKQILLERKILTPFLWFGRLGFHYDIPVEVVCDAKAKDRLLEILSGFPLIYLYYTSDRGILFWLETPQSHLEAYHWFLNSLKMMKGIRSVKSILAIAYRGGRPNRDILTEFEYNEDGFLNTSGDVYITDYL